MESAINEAIRGNKELGKYPMGAVVIKGNKIISKSCNGLPNNLDPTAHAEVLVIRKAAKKLGTRDLNDCILYTTSEPCAMCAGSVVWANMAGIVFGTNVIDLEKFWKKRRNENTSERKFIFNPVISVLKGCKPKPIIIKNFMRKECLKLFELYDKDLRR